MVPVLEALNQAAQSLQQRLQSRKGNRLHQQFEEAQHAAKIGNWSYEIKTGKIYWSKELYNLHPVPADGDPPDFATLCSMVHPEDRAAFLAKVEACVKEGIPYHTLHRIVFPDRVLWMDGYGRAKRSVDGEIVEILGTAQDVSEQVERRQETQFIMDALRLGVWKYHPATGEFHWDAGMYRIFGAKSEDYASHNEARQAILSQEARNLIQKTLNEAMEAGNEFELVYEHSTKSDVKKYISSRGRLVRDNNGKVLAVYGVNMDISEQRRNEFERNKVSELFQLVLQNIPTAIFVKDMRTNLRFSLLNKAGEAMFGLQESQVLGKSDHDFFPKEQADFFVKKDREVFESGNIVTIENEPIDTPKGTRILRTSKVPTFDEERNPKYLIGISSDITEEVQAKEALEQERFKTIRQARLISMGEMSAGIAHEINNPLAVIAASVGLLPKLLGNPEKVQSKIEVIRKSCDRIAKIVMGLKKFSRAAEKAPHQKLSLKKIAEEVLTLTESKSKRHDTPVTFDGIVEGLIAGSEVEIEQVLVNLINNGIDAVKDLRPKWVKVGLREEDDFVYLSVTDSGKGIPESVRNKLFEPFFTTKPVGEGTGLGLSITKGILDDHHASITILNSNPNTCFELKFPKHRAEKKAA